MSMDIEDQKILWDAINRYAQARRADMKRTGVEIQHAVVEVNNAVERILIRSRFNGAVEAALKNWRSECPCACRACQSLEESTLPPRPR